MELQRNSVREQIRELILERIARGEIAPGERIVEARITELTGASSIPVREAIRELVAMRILDSAPHRGAWVREVSLDETVQAFEVRSVLEPLAARGGAERLASEVGTLRRAAKAIVKAARRRDFAEFQQHNQLFHRTIVMAGGNDVLVSVWESLAFQVRTRFVMDFLTSADPVKIAEEHLPIVEAIESGDCEAAAKSLATHSDHLVKYLASSQSAGKRLGA